MSSSVLKEKSAGRRLQLPGYLARNCPPDLAGWLASADHGMAPQRPHLSSAELVASLMRSSMG